MTYAVAEREKARSAVRRLQSYAQEAQIAAMTLKPLPEKVAEAIRTLTGTLDTSKQIDALNHMSEDMRRRHLAQLKPLAVNDFNAFCEYINPEEPPESKWHIWLTQKLQEIELNPELGRFILNCPPGHAKPLHIDTPVLMADGTWKRLADVEVGDYVLTDQARARKVTAVHEQGTLPLLKITTKKNRVILSAFDHSFRTFDESGAPVWKEAQALRPGSELQIVQRASGVRKRPPGCAYDRRDAVMAGLFAGRGSHVIDGEFEHYRLWVSNAWQQAHAERLLTEIGVKYAVHAQPRGRIMIRLSKRDIRSMLPYLQKWEGRAIPNWVFSSGDDIARDYLVSLCNITGSLWSSGGTTSQRIAVSTKSFAIELQRLFAMFQIDATIKESSGGQRWAVFVSGENLLRLMDLGFEHPKLTEDLLSHTKGKTDPTRDTVKSIEIHGDGECRCLTVEEDHTFIAEGVVVHNSTYASRLFVAWRMGRNPTHKIIGGGHSQTFVENEFSAKIRAIVGSPEYAGLFPDVVISSDTRAKNQWNLAGKGGQYAARGVGQGVHGFRAHFVCVDDPYSKVEDAESPVMREKVETWFTNDLGSRMLPTGKMFLIMTRFHENDLTGALLEQNKILPSYARWYHVEAPALCIDPETDVLGRELGEVLWDYYDLKYFLAKKTEWSFQRFSLVYQQRTDAISDDKVSGHFQYYHYLPHQSPEAQAKAKAEGRVDEIGRPIVSKREYFRRIIVSVDTASKPGERNDYTVIQTWGETKDRKHYLMRQQRIKVAFNDMIVAIERQARQDDADLIIVEDKGQGTAYIQARGATDSQRRLAPCPIIGVDPKGQSKEFRFDEVSPIIASGDVFLPARAKWLDAYLKEFGQFPDGAHDDQVDATTQYLKYNKSTRTRYGTRDVSGMG